MGKKSTHIITTIMGFILLSFSKVVLAVPTLEISSGSGTNSSGPSVAAQTNTYLFNANNPDDNNFSTEYFPKTSVTYSIENQQYDNNSNALKGLVFGGNVGNSTSSASIFTNIGAVGNPDSNDFTANRVDLRGSGISKSANYGTWLFLKTGALNDKARRYTKNENNGLGHYMGDIVLRFNRGVKNPVINVAGLGGTAGDGITANLKLVESPSDTYMYRLSGRSLKVSNNEIRNDSSTYSSNTGDGGASGSVQIESAREITTLRFSLYLASDYYYDDDGWFGPSKSWSSSGGDAFSLSAASIDSMVGDLVVSKTNSTTQVYSGGTTTYTVRVSNNGPDTYTGTELKDVVETGLTATAIACSNAVGNKCSTAPALNSLASIDTGSLASGEFYEILITARVDAAVGTKVKNTASVKPPTLGSSTGLACRATLTGDTSLTRTFDEGTGTCTMSDEDTVLAGTDLEVSKISDKTTYNTGDVVKYTIKAWNNSTVPVADAKLTDDIPINLASLSWTCTKSGTAVCPTSANMVTSESSNSLTATGLSLPANGKDVNYLVFTITGLAYKVGSVANTASIISPSIPETNSANNSATANMTIMQNTPITTGSSQNQCSSGQAVNLVSNTAFSSYDADNTVMPNNYELKTGGDNPTVLPSTVMYGTGPNGALQVRGRVSWSYGSPRSNTTGVTMRVLVDGVIYAVLVTPGKSSNSTASFSALNGAQVDTTDYAIGSYGTDPVAINFTITLPTTVTVAKVVRTEFQNVRPNASTYVGDDIGIGLNELNMCLKPTFEMNKVSENGTDSFNFGSFTNLTDSNAETITSGEVVTTVVGTAQSVRLKKSTSPVEQGSLLAYATPNTAISFAESASTLYSLKTVECKDTNTDVSGNSTGNLGSLSGLTQTIPAANVKFASKFVCRVTNSKNAGYVFSGRVFNDNSGTTMVDSNAYNGIEDIGELGIASSVVELQDCSTQAVLASATTDKNGDFRIQTLQDVFSSRSKVCLVQRNVNGYDSVSAKQKGSVLEKTTNDLFEISKVQSVTSYEGFLFGDAELQLVLSQNGQKTIAAGDVVDYPHELMAKSVMNVLNVMESKEQQPANNQPWQSLVYVDSNCNAQLDQGESLLTSRTIKANEKVCLIQRVVSPTTGQGGDRFIASFKVNGKGTYSTATAKESNSVNDITTIGTAGLNITKLVRKTSTCPAPSNNSTPFTVSNQAAKGDYLEYQMTYTNNSNKNLVDVVLKDSVPIGTVYGAMSCTATGCQTEANAGQLKWTIPGVLAPKQNGQVGFCVRIPD